MTLYLASTSPRRRNLLRRLGLKPRFLKPDFAEPAAAGFDPDDYVLHCARAKAASCRSRVRSGLIVGVDTVVALGRRIIGKPVGRPHARRILNMLSGRTHQVMSGLAIIVMPTERVLTGLEVTSVSFRRLAAAEIEDYVRCSEPYDKAGAYAIQGRAGTFVRHIDGCYLNVIGLPVPLLLRMLRRAGWRERLRAKSG